MYCDLPKLSRCCFCVPLRYGLQVWGYIKLIIEMAFLIFVLAKSWFYLMMVQFMSPITILLLILSIDVTFSVLLVVATHMKHEKLFKFYYIYSVVILIVMMGGLVLDLSSSIVISVSDFNARYSPFLMHIVIINGITMIGMTLLQVYVTLLVRTELVKLRDNSNMQFINHTSDPRVVAATLP